MVMPSIKLNSEQMIYANHSDLAATVKRRIIPDTLINLEDSQDFIQDHEFLDSLQSARNQCDGETQTERVHPQQQQQDSPRLKNSPASSK